MSNNLYRMIYNFIYRNTLGKVRKIKVQNLNENKIYSKSTCICPRFNGCFYKSPNF